MNSRPRSVPKARSVLISYHRASSHGHAQTFYRALDSGSRSAPRVPGTSGATPSPSEQDWRQAVESSLGDADALLLIVDPDLQERLSDPADAVRFELQTAIKHGVRIVPVRVDGAKPFSQERAVSPFEFLTDANAPAIRPESSVSDVNLVVQQLTGHAPGEVRVADAWDAVAVAVVLGVGALAWASWGRGRFSVSEMVVVGRAPTAPDPSLVVWPTGHALPGGYHRHLGAALCRREGLRRPSSLRHLGAVGLVSVPHTQYARPGRYPGRTLRERPARRVPAAVLETLERTGCGVRSRRFEPAGRHASAPGGG